MSAAVLPAARRRDAADRPRERGRPGDRARTRPRRSAGRRARRTTRRSACSGAAIANSSVAAIVTRRGPKRSARLPAGTRREQHGRAVGADDDARLRLAQAERLLPARQQRRDREPEHEIEEHERADEHRQPAARRAVPALRDLPSLRAGASRSARRPARRAARWRARTACEPKKPLCAESGLGCALSMQGCGREQRLERARVAAPEDRDERPVPHRERADRLLGDGLPALAAVRARVARRDGEDAVEQQDALLRPGREVAVGRLRVAEILAVLLEDVAQAARQRPDVGRDAEREPDRMAGRRVRILADDQHAHVVERLLERGEDARRLGQERPVGGPLGPEEVAELGDHVAHGRERIGPAGADGVGQAAGRGVGGAHACDRRGRGAAGPAGLSDAAFLRIVCRDALRAKEARSCPSAIRTCSARCRSAR